jgi:WD40 repeat protein
MCSRQCLWVLLVVRTTFGPDPIARAADTQPARADVYGDTLPPGAVARMGSPRFRHGTGVTVLAASPDGKMLASSGYFALRLWDAATGQELGRLPQRPPAHGIAFSPDSKTLAAGFADGAIMLWDLCRGRELRRWPGHKDGVNAVTFSPNGIWLASAGNDGTVRLWDLVNGKELRRLTGHGARSSVRGQPSVPSVTTVVFSPDARTLASGGVDGTIRLWEAATGTELRRIAGHAITVPQMFISWHHPVLSISALAFAPDGKSLASACALDKDACLWDPRTGKELQRLKGHEHGAHGLAFSPDGQTLATGGRYRDGLIRLWDPATGKQRCQLAGHPDGVSSLVFLKGGQILVSASDGWDCSIRRWDVAAGTAVSPSRGHQSVVASLAFAPDSKTLASASWDRTVRLWEPETGRQLRRLEGHAGEANAVAYAPDGKVIASGSVNRDAPGSVRFWDAATGKFLRRLRHEHGARRVLFTPNGANFVVCDNQATIHLWDTVATTETRSFPVDRTTLAALSPDGRYLAVDAEYGNLVIVFDQAKGRELYRLQGDKKSPLEVTWLAFSPDSRSLAATSGNQRLRLWEVATARERWTAASDDWLYTVAFSPGGRLLATGSRDCTVQLWDYSTGKQVHRFRGHRGTIDAVAFDPRGDRLATAGSDTTILVWDVSGMARKAKRSRTLSAQEMAVRWTELASTDAGVAFRALGDLAAAPGVVPWIQQQWQPSLQLAPELAALIGDLESRHFAMRARATQELTRRGAAAEPALRWALARASSLETRTRVQQLLDRLEGPIAHPDVMRELRAIEVLENLGTADARKLLARLAEGVPGAWWTEAARATLQRLSQRPLQ